MPFSIAEARARCRARRRAAARARAPLPSVASINLCADQLVLTVAAPEQIAHRELALGRSRGVAARGAGRALSAQLRLGRGAPALSSRRRDRRRVHERIHARAARAARLQGGRARARGLHRGHRAQRAARRRRDRSRRARRGSSSPSSRARERQIAAARPVHAPATVVVRPGGFTVGEHSLADELMKLAGVRNVAAEQGLDRWGSLSMETLLASAPSSSC